MVDSAGFLWTKSVDASAYGSQLLRLYEKALEMERNGLEDDLFAQERVKIVDDDVVHIGLGILALGMQRGIDFDSDSSAVKAIFLRQEQRAAARDIVDAVEKSTKGVLTGSAGSGKTFGTMAAIVAELLRRGRPVLRMSKMPNRAALLWRRDDGRIDAWTADLKGEFFGKVDLANDSSVHAVVDPPEAGIGARFIGLNCHVIVVPCDDKKKHYAGVNKSSPVYYSDPPTPDECVLMCEYMWSSDKSQKPGEAPATDGEIDDAIQARMLLVGPFPRYIIDWTNFTTRVSEIITATNVLPLDQSTSGLIRSIINQDADIGESGKLKATYVKRRPSVVGRHEYEQKINDLVAYLLQGVVRDLVKAIEAEQGPSTRGSLVERDMCEPALLNGGSFNVVELTLGLRKSTEKSVTLVAGTSFSADFPKRTLVSCPEKKISAGYEKMDDIGNGDLLRMPTWNFPFIDFASKATENGSFELINSRTGSKGIKTKTGLNFLEKLGVVQSSVDSDGNETWTTVKHDFECKLYFTGIDNFRSSLLVTGPKAERDLLLQHVKMYRLELYKSGSDRRKQIDRKVSVALSRYDYQDGIVARADEATNNV